MIKRRLNQLQDTKCDCTQCDRDDAVSLSETVRRLQDQHIGKSRNEWEG